MNQWFYNIAGGIVHKIGEKRTTISEATFRGKREILSKINKARVSYLTILKRKTLSLLLKDETDQFVICLVLPECLSVKKYSLVTDSEANRDGADAEFPFPLFFLFLPHLRTLAHEKRSENCLRFATSGPSLCLYPLL